MRSSLDEKTTAGFPEGGEETRPLLAKPQRMLVKVALLPQCRSCAMDVRHDEAGRRNKPMEHGLIEADGWKGSSEPPWLQRTKAPPN